MTAQLVTHTDRESYLPAVLARPARPRLRNDLGPAGQLWERAAEGPRNDARIARIAGRITAQAEARETEWMAGHRFGFRLACLYVNRGHRSGVIRAGVRVK